MLDAMIPGSRSAPRLRGHRFYLSCVSLLGIGVLGLGALAGCVSTDLVGGSTKRMDVDIPRDAFLPRPDLLGRTKGTLWTLTYFRRGTDFGKYRSIFVDPVEILAGPASRIASLPEEQREALADTFSADVVSALRTSCHVAPRPGPGVIRVRLALSDATASNAVVKTVANYTPYVMIAYKVGSRTFNSGVGYFSGTATAEAYATDAATGDLLWQGVDRRGGTTALLQDTTDNWLDVHHAFQAWAGQFVTKLQATGLCVSPPS